MPHNGTSTNNESDASERQNQQRQNPQEKDSRSQHKLKTYSSPLCPAQSSSSTKVSAAFDHELRESLIISSHVNQAFVQQSTSDKVGKHHPQFRQHRPSVLRKGSQLLSQVLSVRSGLPKWDTDVVCKTEPQTERTSAQSSNQSLENTNPYTRPKTSGSSHGHRTPEHNFNPLQSGVPESSLFTNGFCKWPGCNEVFKEYTIFLKHLRTEHGPGDKSIAQWRMQSDIVQHMENQLAVEKQKLREMHLHLLGIRSTLEDDSLEQSSHLSESLQQCQGINGLPSASRDSTELLARGYWHLPTSQLIPGVAPSIECYKYTNIRPPFTYASMIRWAILESPEKQLTLNEIYHWFTRMFFYFRHNTATWKNAVRHNLSLHKCFVRVEGGKGSVWTVDEVEFLKRKGQKLHRDHDFTWMAHYPFFYT